MKRFHVGLFVCSLLVSGCASQQKAIFYPNDHFEKVGAAQAEQDYQDCLARALSAGVADSTVETAAGRGAKAGAVGGSAGAVHAVVRGRNVGRSAGAAAAGAATGGFVSGMIRDRPDPVTRRFPERCLGEKGYSTIGWRQSGSRCGSPDSAQRSGASLG
jgi:outer membrane lipoprotein SlyB